jgi:DNA-binding response OmpR family regulator
MRRILLAGNDSRLQETRAAVLLRTGAAVIHRNTQGTLDILDRETFDLVVLCHSLLEADVTAIVEKIHRKIPGAKILMVISSLDQYETHPDRKVDATSVTDPGHLVAQTKELLEVAAHASPAKGRDGFGPIYMAVD